MEKTRLGRVYEQSIKVEQNERHHHGLGRRIKKNFGIWRDSSLQSKVATMVRTDMDIDFDSMFSVLTRSVLDRFHDSNIPPRKYA